MDKYSPNRTIVPSRSIYDLVQIRRNAARLAKSHRNNYTNQSGNMVLKKNTYAPKMQTLNPKTNLNQLKIERLKIVIAISSIAVVFMIILVIICIAARYYHDQNPVRTDRTEPLNSSKPKKSTTKYMQINQDTRNFSRKPRTLPAAV
jgi:hypothetical protein